MYVLRNIVERLEWKRNMGFLCIAELNITVNNTKILGVA
jgi:hypothetical protein